MKPYLTYLIGALAGACLAFAACYYYHNRQATEQSLPAPVAKELKGKETKLLECKPIIVYRDSVKKTLNLPEAVKVDINRQVVAATQVPGDERPRTVTAVTNLESGQVDLFVRKDPMPWLTFSRKMDLGISYGTTPAGAVTRIDGRYEFARIKSAHLGLIGSADNSGDWYGGLGVWVRW